MEKIKINIDAAKNVASNKEIKELTKKAEQSNLKLHNKTGLGNDFLAWVNLPNEISKNDIEDITKKATELRKKLDVVVVIGIGGSYLGAKAVIDSLSDSFGIYSENKLKVIYAGHNLSEDYLYELLNYLDNKNWGITVISKSGTTTEPAIAFRILKKQLEQKFGEKEANTRIVAITDAKKGALRSLADTKNYKTYVIADDIGGRYSVLTPVGLFPVALAGFDISKIIEGAKAMYNHINEDSRFDTNIAIQYAVARNILYGQNKKIEVMVNYNPKLHYFAEWWKQLYGESEGKEEKGIFPASVDFTTDLHSMGQYLQEGERTMFETVISVNKPKQTLSVPHNNENLDGLNYLSGRRVHQINKMAEIGTTLAHTDGGVPNLKITIPEINEYYIGQLIYFFEKACGISGYMLDVNPFDQPGVEAYKKNMFALLGKKGFEKETEIIKNRIV